MDWSTLQVPSARDGVPKKLGKLIEKLAGDAKRIAALRAAADELSCEVERARLQNVFCSREPYYAMVVEALDAEISFHTEAEPAYEALYVLREEKHAAARQNLQASAKNAREFLDWPEGRTIPPTVLSAVPGYERAVYEENISRVIRDTSSDQRRQTAHEHASVELLKFRGMLGGEPKRLAAHANRAEKDATVRDGIAKEAEARENARLAPAREAEKLLA